MAGVPGRPAADGVDPETITAYVAQQWPDARPTVCHEVSGRHAVVSSPVDPRSIRPGGFVSGPSLFGLADLALWFATFGAIGLEAMALTSELSIRFVRPAIGDTLWARADLSSVGRKNVVGSVVIWTDDPDRPTAVCQGTYVVPPRATETEEHREHRER